MVSVLPLLRLLTVASAALLALGDASSPAQQSPPSASPKVKLPTGATVTGKPQMSVSGRPVNAFLGIPYTDAPIGDKRWKQSTVKTLTQDLNATSYGSICYGNPASDAVSGQLPPSEDCLYLNVFTPAGATSKDKLPVMVWVHGGGFAAGAGNPYDGSNLVGASGNKVVVVNFNYRLGALGFLSNDEILKQGQGANFGLRDQEVAFQWVKKHISAFGGNRNDITAFAESAGAKSLSLHMLSRDANQQLFRRAILQSGAYPTAASTPSPTLQAAHTTKIAAAVGCEAAQHGAVLACLRKANASAIGAVSNTLSWVPTVDGVFLLEEPIRRVLAGTISRVPTLMGTNTDDGYLFGSDADLATWIRTANTQMTETEYARVLELYPAESFATNKHRSGEVFNDYNFACPSELLSDVLATSSTPVPSYRYRFNYTSTEYGYPLVVHAKDLDYVFNRVANLPTDDATAQVVRDFQTFWTNYAVSGTPNGAAGAASVWPAYNVATKQQLVLQPTLALETSGLYPSRHAERCAFWHAVDLRIASSS